MKILELNFTSTGTPYHVSVGYFCKDNLGIKESYKKLLNDVNCTTTSIMKRYKH